MLLPNKGKSVKGKITGLPLSLTQKLGASFQRKGETPKIVLVNTVEWRYCPN